MIASVRPPPSPGRLSRPRNNTLNGRSTGQSAIKSSGFGASAVTAAFAVGVGPGDGVDLALATGDVASAGGAVAVGVGGTATSEGSDDRIQTKTPSTATITNTTPAEATLITSARRRRLARPEADRRVGSGDIGSKWRYVERRINYTTGMHAVNRLVG